jgi:hypothetical protein
LLVDLFKTSLPYSSAKEVAKKSTHRYRNRHLLLVLIIGLGFTKIHLIFLAPFDR